MPVQKITPFLWFDQQAEVMKAKTMKSSISALQHAFDNP